VTFDRISEAHPANLLAGSAFALERSHGRRPRENRAACNAHDATHWLPA
jgi:hypothetical protein